MKKNIEQIITEEIERELSNIPFHSPKQVSKVLKELFTFSTDSFLKNIGSQEVTLDEDADLPEENWEWLIQTINEAYNEDKESWNDKLKEQKLKILCYKYFTKQEFIDEKSVEKKLKVDIKKYFTALQNFSDLNDFQEKFFNLPFETLNNFIRYILNKSEKLNKTIKITKKELKQKLQIFIKERKQVVKKIALISKKYQDTLNLTKVKELYENGLFFEDNLINRAVNEYIVKLLNHKEAAEKIKDTLNSALLLDLKFHSENSVAYVKHYDSVRREESQEYFTVNGFQIGTRFDNEIEISDSKNKQEDYVIDDKSRLKEPFEKINKSVSPWESSEGLDATGEEGTEGSGTGGSGGGGGLSPQSGAGVGLPGGGGFSDAPPDLQAGDLDAPDNAATPEDLESSEAAEGEMPTDDDGFPVDFGTPETNPDAVEKK